MINNTIPVIGTEEEEDFIESVVFTEYEGEVDVVSYHNGEGHNITHKVTPLGEELVLQEIHEFFNEGGEDLDD